MSQPLRDDIQLTGVRPAAVAGQFYPKDPEELGNLVRMLLANATPGTAPAPKALIVPHAGYTFSGPVAASAYALLAPARAAIKRVVLAGPSHRVGFDGLATVSVAAFATPLGQVPVDAEAVRSLAALPEVCVNDRAHACEHSLEVQLPFLQTVLDEFAVVPLLMVHPGAETVSRVLNAVWGGAETCIIVSSDLSHFHPSAEARELDEATAQAIAALRPEGIGEEGACGRQPICGLLRSAQQRGLRARALEVRNSGDTGGPHHRVVGYGAFSFDEAEAAG